MPECHEKRLIPPLLLTPFSSTKYSTVNYDSRERKAKVLCDELQFFPFCRAHSFSCAHLTTHNKVRVHKNNGRDSSKARFRMAKHHKLCMGLTENNDANNDKTNYLCVFYRFGGQVSGAEIEANAALQPSAAVKEDSKCDHKRNWFQDLRMWISIEIVGPSVQWSILSWKCGTESQVCALHPRQVILCERWI